MENLKLICNKWVFRRNRHPQLQITRRFLLQIWVTYHIKLVLDCRVLTVPTLDLPQTDSNKSMGSLFWHNDMSEISECICKPPSIPDIPSWHWRSSNTTILEQDLFYSADIWSVFSNINKTHIPERWEIACCLSWARLLQGFAPASVVSSSPD